MNSEQYSCWPIYTDAHNTRPMYSCDWMSYIYQNQSVYIFPGYGQHYPSTTLGRGICVVYALIGIPLTLIVLGGIGEQFSLLAQKVNQLKLCSKKPTVNKGFNIIIIVLSGLVIMFVLPSLLFNIVEGWSILEAIYYCFITLSTIGFGDYIAGIYTLILIIYFYVWLLIIKLV